MKKLLVISYSFPPVGGAGVQRPVKFVKYLRQFAWEPVVLTVANPSVPVLDHSLLRDIPDGVLIHKARTLEPSYNSKIAVTGKNNGVGASLKKGIRLLVSTILLPDFQVLWWPHLCKALFNVIRRERPDCLFVTAPPFSSFIPVVIVGRLLGVPVVVDYRDEWSFSRKTLENLNHNHFAIIVDFVLERLALSLCAAFTSANASYVRSLVSRYGRSARGKGHVITNGYDDDDFAAAIPPLASATKQRPLSLLYAGTVWAATSFHPLLTALSQLRAEDPRWDDLIELSVLGRVVDAEMDNFERSSVGRILHLLGYLEHERAVEQILAADVLVLTLSDLPGAEKIITGKVFEYMASGKHILAIVPEGETRNILSSNYDNMTFAYPGNTDSIVSGIKNICSHIDVIRSYRGKGVPQFSRQNLTGELASVLDKVVGQREP